MCNITSFGLRNLYKKLKTLCRGIEHQVTDMLADIDANKHYGKSRRKLAELCLPDIKFCEFNISFIHRTWH